MKHKSMRLIEIQLECEEKVRDNNQSTFSKSIRGDMIEMNCSKERADAFFLAFPFSIATAAAAAVLLV